MLEELIVIAAVGTSRKQPVLTSISPAVDEVLGALAGASPAAKLLGAVAVLDRYALCGSRGVAAPVSPPAAREEKRPACSSRAGAVLGQILQLSQGESKSHLLGEWLEFAAASGQRVPHRFLPPLLDYAAAHRDTRSAVAAVAGERGGWLMALNPHWRFNISESDDPAATWTTGTRDQRIAALHRLRAGNATAARELVASTWKEDPADDRAAFVGALHTGLSADDESFLESALDDRSKQVRAAAAELLMRLPQPKLLGRMIERAEPLLKFTPGQAGGVLKKSKPGVIEVSLPPEPLLADWARDGIVEKPDARIGRRQWWLQQLLSAIPPAHWSARWQATPDECVAAVPDEFEQSILAAWTQAALRHHDPAWGQALLLASAKDKQAPNTLALLRTLGKNARQAVTTELIELSNSSVELLELLRDSEFTFDPHASAALLRQIDRQRDQLAVGQAYFMTPIFQAAALRLPPANFEQLAARWSGQTWEPFRKSIDEFFQTFAIRRDVQREFNS